MLIGIFLGLTQPLSSMAMNAYSRRAEYRADRQAVEEGYGAALITGLKMLAKENFAHLAPSPVAHRGCLSVGPTWPGGEKKWHFLLVWFSLYLRQALCS